MFNRTFRITTYAALALMLLLIFYVLLAPEISADKMAQPTLQFARSMFVSWFFPAILVAFVLSLVAAALLAPFAGSLRRKEGVGGAWILLATRCEFLLIPAALVLVAVSSFAVAVAAPFSAEQKIIAIHGITVDDSYSARRTSAIRLDKTSRLAGPYISTSSAIWNLSAPLSRLLIQASAGDLSDFFVRRHYLFAVRGPKLYTIDTTDGASTITANLPMAGLRFGQIKRDFGGASDFLLWGSEGNKSFVYEIRATGDYTKLVDSADKVVGASTCIDRTWVATPTRVIQLRPGFKPVEAFRVPEGDEVTSILARQDGVGDRDRCILLIATANAVYALQNGVATMLVAGMGGNLGAIEEENLNFTLVDYARNAAVGVSFDARPDAAP